MIKFSLTLLLVSSSLVLAQQEPLPNTSPLIKPLTLYQWVQTARVDAQELIERKEYKKLEALYKKMDALNSQNYMTLEQYQDYLIEKAYSEAYLNHFDRALEQMREMDHTQLNENQLVRKDLLMAKLYYAKEDIVSTFSSLLQASNRASINQWGMQDRLFYIKVERQVHHYFEKKMKAAQNAYNEAKKSEALSYYQEVYEGVKKGLFNIEEELFYNDICTALGEIYYDDGKWDLAKEVLKEVHQSGYLDLHRLYLLIDVEKQKGEFELAIAHCKDYLHSGPHQDLEQLEAVQFLEAFFKYKLGNLKEAESMLLKLTVDLKREYFRSLSRITLGEIYLEKGDLNRVESWLDPQFFNFEDYPLLKAQWIGLKGKTCFKKGEFERAIGYLSEITSAKNEKVNFEKLELLNLVATAYLNLGEKEEHLELKQRNLVQSEQIFRELIKKGYSHSVPLKLAKVYFLKSKFLGDGKAEKQIEELLSSPFCSNSEKFQIGLMQAEIYQNLKRKEEVYSLIATTFWITEEQKGFLNFLRAKNKFNLALSEGVKTLFEEVIVHLNGAWEILSLKGVEVSESAIKLYALSLAHLNQREDLQMGYQFLEDFLTRFPQESGKERLEGAILYFKAYLCSKLALLEEGASYFEKGIRNLERLLNTKKSSPWNDHGQYMLGTLYYQHKDYTQAIHSFLKLVENYPQSKWSGDAWFWMAESTLAQNGDLLRVKGYRKRVYELYPHSSHAAEAYLNYYSLEEYLTKVEALEHLSSFVEKFPNSPYVIVAYYYQARAKQRDQLDLNGKRVGLKDFSKAQDFAHLALESFRNQYAMSQIPKEQFLFFAEIYYDSFLIEAKSLLREAEISSEQKRGEFLKKAIALYRELCFEFDHSEHPLSALFKAKAKYPIILQKAHYGLARAYIQNFELDRGEGLFKEMLSKFSEGEISKGKAIFKVWKELGIIAMAKEEYGKALDYFTASLAASESREENKECVHVELQMSLCFRALHEFDKSILVLSRIINEEKEPKLKGKAMYLRAEVYEKQGKGELAKKQLEAAAKHGGEWARMSQDRLIAEYDMSY